MHYFNYNYFINAILGVCIALTLRCDHVADCHDSSDELDCVDQITTHKVGRQLKYFTTDDANSLKCDSRTSAVYPLNRLCVRDSSLPSICQHSENLFHCESFECPAMFKVSVNCTPKTFVRLLPTYNYILFLLGTIENCRIPSFINEQLCIQNYINVILPK